VGRRGQGQDHRFPDRAGRHRRAPGHTVIVGRTKYILHLIPSGILRRRTTCVIGNGVVVDPIGLLEEIDGLKKTGIDPAGRLHVSDAAHMVFPYHKALDAAREALKGEGKIGTTLRGIGPAYGDKVDRTGLRMGSILNQLAEAVNRNNALLKSLGAKPLPPKRTMESVLKATRRLRPYVANTVQMLHNATAAKKRILFEGAQGTFLDIDHGTYPYVTSSNTTAGGMCTGSGIAPNRIDRVIGVAKAYTTRVGEGPMPSEAQVVGDLLHGMGREYGATTGRERRCGWFDAVTRHHRPRGHEHRRLGHARVDQDLHRLQTWWQTDRPPAKRPRPVGQMPRHLRNIPRLADADRQDPHVESPAAQRPALRKGLGQADRHPPQLRLRRPCPLTDHHPVNPAAWPGA